MASPGPLTEFRRVARFLRGLSRALRLHRGDRCGAAAGYAVRRDWPDGSHDLYGWRPSATAVQRRIKRTRASLRLGPWHYGTLTVVRVSRRDVRLHARRDLCRAPDCPTPVTLVDRAPFAEAR